MQLKTTILELLVMNRMDNAFEPIENKLNDKALLIRGLSSWWFLMTASLLSLFKNCCYNLQQTIFQYCDPVSLFFQTEEKLYKSVPTRARVTLC